MVPILGDRSANTRGSPRVLGVGPRRRPGEEAAQEGYDRGVWVVLVAGRRRRSICQGSLEHERLVTGLGRHAYVTPTAKGSLAGRQNGTDYSTPPYSTREGTRVGRASAPRAARRARGVGPKSFEVSAPEPRPGRLCTADVQSCGSHKTRGSRPDSGDFPTQQTLPRPG